MVPKTRGVVVSSAALKVEVAPTHALRHLRQKDVPCRDHLTSSWPSVPTQTTFGVQCGLTVDVGDHL